MQELKSIVTPVNNCKPIKLLWYNSMNLPPTGLPKSTAIEMNADWIPFLVPIWLLTDIWPTNAGASEVNALANNPYKPEKTNRWTLLTDNSQRVRTSIPDEAVVKITTLSRPTWSAIYPWSMRPKKLFVVSVYVFKFALDFTLHRSSLQWDNRQQYLTFRTPRPVCWWK
jgi:hypothetical protein